MTTPRQATSATLTAIATLWARFEDRFCCRVVRSALWHSPVGLLPQREPNTTLMFVGWNKDPLLFIGDSTRRARHGRLRQRHLSGAAAVVDRSEPIAAAPVGSSKYECWQGQ
jgi:hypothetical protein